MSRLKLTVTFLAVFMTLGVYADQRKGPMLSFKKDRHDYGTLYADNLPEFTLDIEFVNSGNEPLILSNVRACCGTRVTAWPRQPIMPQETGVVKIVFRLAPRPQRISRSVTVTSNSTDRPVQIFRISGQVVDREQQ